MSNWDKKLTLGRTSDNAVRAALNEMKARGWRPDQKPFGPYADRERKKRQEAERLRGIRNHHMKITLPRVRCLEEGNDDEPVD